MRSEALKSDECLFYRIKNIEYINESIIDFANFR
jgi:hypothetical protein